mgnify:CR=1 FL=1
MVTAGCCCVVTTRHTHCDVVRLQASRHQRTDHVCGLKSGAVTWVTDGREDVQRVIFRF